MTVPTRPLYTPNLQPGEAERTAIIDLNALEHNTRVLKDMIGERKLIAVVKADAYGHGAYPVARSVLEAGADILGVVHVTEALELRSEGITAPIIAWLHTPQTDFDEALEADIILGASGWDLEAIAEAANRTKKRARVHLKVDTGLGRNGSTFEDWPALVARALELEAAGLVRIEGIFLPPSLLTWRTPRERSPARAPYITRTRRSSPMRYAAELPSTVFPRSRV